jgi:hypothetical protein
MKIVYRINGNRGPYGEYEYSKYEHAADDLEHAVKVFPNEELHIEEREVGEWKDSE